MNYKNLIKKNNVLLAHWTIDRTETLVKHMDNTYEVFKKLDKTYNIIPKFLKSLKNMKFFKGKNKKEFCLSSSSIEFIKTMFTSAIPIHDIGKINPKFQKEKMNIDIQKIIDSNNFNKLNRKLSNMNTYHSMISSIIYIDVFLKDIFEMKSITNEEQIILVYFLFSFANSIICHHSNLDNLETNFSQEKLKEFISILDVSEDTYLLFYNNSFTLRNIVKNNFNFLDCIKSIHIDDTISIYIWNKILYSLIIYCDFVSTYCFYKNINIENYSLHNIENLNNLKSCFENSPIYKGIESFKYNKNYFKNNGLPIINELRSEMLLNCRENLLKNKNSKMFNIPAPTGSGKSMISISCALELLEDKKKLFYIFPINTLATQTRKVLNDIFKNELDIHEINSITPLPLTTENDGTIDYSKILLDRQILNYESVITSNVNFFNLLFGCDRTSSMGLISLFDSVIILDEIQNYKNSIWRETIEFLYKFSEIMDFKIIIMSATLPNLEELVGFKKNRFITLLDNSKKYYNHPLFKNRVFINNKLLKKSKVTFQDLTNLIIEETEHRNSISGRGYSKFLIEFITKKSAVAFYDYIRDKLPNNYIVYELDGDDNTLKKMQVINECKKENLDKNIVLITTQIIEAGIDIDFDLGAKDAAFPDTDEQFLGRINRSCKKKNCSVFFFNLDKEEYIYRDDYRIGTNIRNPIFFECLKNKDFETMYKKVFEKITEKKDTNLNSFMNNFYNKELKLMRNKSIYKNMKLIDNETFEIFIPNTINGIDGEKVWNDFVSLVDDKYMTYAQKKILLINMREKLNYFTYSIYGKGLCNISPTYGVYYIQNGSKFIKNEKFDSETFKMKYTIQK